MASIETEKASEFFARIEKDSSSIHLEKNILPILSPENIVQVCGGPGSGKTELLYHFIVRSILPDIGLKGLQFKGLSVKVILIDNELRFDLFRLTKILERRIRSFGILNRISVGAEEISSFIDERLEFLEIIKCLDFDEFVGSLRYLELLQSQKYVLMIDGINSFYWSNKMRSSSSSLVEPNALIPSMLKNVSKNCGVPIIVTKRKLSQSPAYDQRRLAPPWRKIITRQLELTYNCSKENITNLSVSDVISGRQCLCAVGNSGFRFYH